MYSLKQINDALSELCVLGGDKQYALNIINEARNNLTDALLSLDELTVAGRNVLDSLLGCMMALEQIIGGDNNG